MTITCTESTMVSDSLPSVSARFSPDAAADGEGAWVVSWIPARLFTRDQARTAMVLAQHVAEGHGRNAYTEAWAAVLHLSAGEVLKLLAPVLGEQGQISAARGSQR